MLMVGHKTQRMASAWVSFLNVEVKTVDARTFAIEAENFKQTLSVCQKPDGNCFLGQDRKGVLMVITKQITQDNGNFMFSFLLKQ
jgi:hypothetical protein